MHGFEPGTGSDRSCRGRSLWSSVVAVAVLGLWVLVTTAPALAAAQAAPIPATDCVLAGQASHPALTATPATLPFPPLQLDISTPFEPTLVPGGGVNYLVYELHLQNYAEQPLSL